MPAIVSLPQPGHQPNAASRLAAEHPGIVRFGRVGWFAKGLVYAIAGVLALVVAVAASGWSDTTGSPSTPDATTAAAGQEASPTGALKKIAETSAAPFLLWPLAIGLFVYAAWRVLSALYPGDADAESVARRGGYIVSAIIFIVLGATAIRLSGTEPSEADTAVNGNEQASGLTARLMENGLGRWLVGVAGLVAIGAGLYRLVKGVKVDVDDELDLAGMRPERVRWLRRLGAVGEVGRGVGIALIGVFLVRAAFDYEAREATGLDGALRRLADEWWGDLIVASVGIGFAAYGLFCLVTAHRRRLESP